MKCDETKERHFWFFKHEKLAMKRAEEERIYNTDKLELSQVCNNKKPEVVKKFLNKYNNKNTFKSEGIKKLNKSDNNNALNKIPLCSLYKDDSFSVISTPKKVDLDDDLSYQNSLLKDDDLPQNTYFKSLKEHSDNSDELESKDFFTHSQSFEKLEKHQKNTETQNTTIIDTLTLKLSQSDNDITDHDDSDEIPSLVYNKSKNVNDEFSDDNEINNIVNDEFSDDKKSNNIFNDESRHDEISNNIVNDESSDDNKSNNIVNDESSDDDKSNIINDEFSDDELVCLVAEKIEQQQKINDEKEESNNMKASESNSISNKTSNCYHVHLHLDKESTKKVVQTSILKFFKSNKSLCNKIPLEVNKNVIKKYNTKESSNSDDNKSTKNSWENLMKKMQSDGENSSKPSTSKSENTSENSNSSYSYNNYYDGSKNNKKCPFYKYISDTDFVVDAFSYGELNGVRAYFLSHFHYDHYRGITKHWRHPVYCSKITANLLRLKIKLDDKYIKILPLDEPRVIFGVEVTLLDANHCPGSVMFLFKLVTGKTILHVGDFRAHPKHESMPALWNCNIDVLYLDTTYCDSFYRFPSQDDILEKCTSIVKNHIKLNPKTLIFVGSYTIGKERVFKSFATAIDCKIWANPEKLRILNCLEDDEIKSRLTSDKNSAQIHVIPMKRLNNQNLKEDLRKLKHYTHALAFKPTGWEFSQNDYNQLKPEIYENVYIYGVPYSEHSSYNELERFVKFIRPKEIIPTVNAGNYLARNKMMNLFRTWLSV